MRFLVLHSEPLPLLGGSPWPAQEGFPEAKGKLGISSADVESDVE